MIRVSDLVSDPSMGLDVLTGEAGLGRAVTWTHISEIPDVAQWLEGGELLLTTGLGIPSASAAQVDYLETLVAAKASGLGIGHRAPPLSDDMLAAGNRYGFPVLRVGNPVPFSRIGRMVAAGNVDVSQSRLALQIRILESLRLWSEGDVDTRSAFLRLESVTGFDIFVVDETGQALMPGMKDAPASVRPEIANLQSRPIITGGYGARIPINGPSAAYVVLKHRSDDGATGVVVARQVATVAAVHLADMYRRQEESLRRGGEILSRLLRGENPRRGVLQYLQENGFDVDAPLRFVALRTSVDAIEIRQLQANLSQGAIPALITTASDHLLLLMQDDLDLLQSSTVFREWTGGVSEAFPLGGDIAKHQRQAVWAMENTDRDLPGLAEYQAVREFSPWTAMNPDAAAAVVDQLLGPIQRYDAERGSELVRSVQTFLDQDRSVARAARELVIHPHTLRYRLDRVAELTGKDLSRTRDVAEFWWAFQALRLPP